MLSLIGKLKGKKKEPVKKVCKCTCGEEVDSISMEKQDIYFCKSCNRLLYYLESDLEVPKFNPFSLEWLKKYK